MSVERPGPAGQQPAPPHCRSAQELRRARGSGRHRSRCLRGEKVSIIGPSGSGKTTLLRCINYLEKPSSGHIYIDGTLIGEKQVNGNSVHLSDRELAKERQRDRLRLPALQSFPASDRTRTTSRSPRARFWAIAPRKRASAAARCWRRSGSATSSTNIPSACRAASSSASPSPACSPCSPSSCCSTRRPRRSIPNSSARCCA